jgi:pimeloyl-ACP methyl ester carboxylesterase
MRDGPPRRRHGAPVGFRLASAHPDRITGLVVQNGSAYVEGLSRATEPLQAYWRDRAAGEADMRGLLTPALTRFQYVELLHRPRG